MTLLKIHKMNISIVRVKWTNLKLVQSNLVFFNFTTPQKENIEEDMKSFRERFLYNIVVLFTRINSLCFIVYYQSE